MTLKSIYASLEKKHCSFRTYATLDSDTWTPPFNREHQASRKKHSDLDQTLCHEQIIGYICPKGLIKIYYLDDGWLKISFEPGIKELPKYDEAGIAFATFIAAPTRHAQAFRALQAILDCEP